MKPLDLSGRRNSTFTNWFTRDQNDELISIDLGVSGDVRAQLLCKRGDDPHSNPLPIPRSKSGGNPMPSSRTDTSAVLASCRTKRTKTCPSWRFEKAYLMALVTSSLTIKAKEIARSA